MKKFIKHICLFFTTGILTLIIIGQINIRITQKIMHSDIFKLRNVKTLIIGDSHTQTGIYDIYLSKSSNISQSSELYIYSFIKLKFLLERNPNIENILLGFAPHNISKEYDEQLDRKRFQGSYFPITSKELIFSFPRSIGWLENFIRFGLGFDIKYGINVFANSVKKKGYRIFDFIGEYYYSEESNLAIEKINDSIIRHYYNIDNEVGVSDIQTKYLMEICKLCDKYNCNLYLVNLPLHVEYRKMIPVEIISNYNIVIENILIDYPEVTYWDFSADAFADSCYGDGDHLNIKGARILTKKISDMLNH